MGARSSDITWLKCSFHSKCPSNEFSVNDLFDKIFDLCQAIKRKFQVFLEGVKKPRASANGRRWSARGFF
jgi:hypothetical protein